MLFNLHWLPNKERIQYKILLITFKALSGQAPGYISDLLEVYVPRRNLKSSSDRKLVVPTYNLETYGRRIMENIRFARQKLLVENRLYGR